MVKCRFCGQDIIGVSQVCMASGKGAFCVIDTRQFVNHLYYGCKPYPKFYYWAKLLVMLAEEKNG